MPISRADLDALRRANDLYAVVTDAGIVLRRPFHAERTASLAVSREAGLYHCFGCGAGGDVIRFVERTQHVGFVAAVQWLARRAGVALPHDADGSDP
jgi:DNA primase